jgi:hypothetical protein
MGFPGKERGSFRKAYKQGLVFGLAETPDELGAFYTLLLASKALHNALPVHTLDEIVGLKARLGRRLNVFTASLHGRVVAGVYCVQVTRDVCYTQYIADAPGYRQLDATRFLLCEIIKTLRAEGVARLDLGPSVRLPVVGLGGARFKESFGAVGCERRKWQLRLK